MKGTRFHEVRTPEQVAFRYELAGPAERACAYGIDLLCMGGLIVLLAIAAGRTGRMGAPLLLIGAFAVQWGYFVWFEWRWNGSTPGKRMLRIRVMQTMGVRCTLERCLLRNLLRVVDFLPALNGLGAAVMLLSRRGARIGDLAAGTVCVRVPRPPAPGAVAEIQRRFNSLREDAAVRERIRQVLTPAEAAVVVPLALRREILEDEARGTVFAEAAGYLRRRLRLERHEGLPDESLVLNVASVLLEERRI